MQQVKKRIIDATVEELKDEILQEIKQDFNNLRELVKTFKPKDEVKWLTRKETAKLLKVSYVTLHNWHKSGKLKAYKLDGSVRYKLNEVNQKFKK